MTKTQKTAKPAYDFATAMKAVHQTEKPSVSSDIVNERKQIRVVLDSAIRTEREPERRKALQTLKATVDTAPLADLKALIVGTSGLFYRVLFAEIRYRKLQGETKGVRL